MKFTKKAPLSGAFLVIPGLLSFFYTSISAAVCSVLKQGTPVEVVFAYDGDTLQLADGRKVRLIGINTPEIGRQGQPDESGSVAAKQRLTAILRASNNQIFLKAGTELQDRYKRYLAHPYNTQGRNITEMLLSEGLGYAVQIPPNLSGLECYREAEQSARARRLGVWKRSIHALDVNDMNGQEEGFFHIQGEVGRIGKSRRSLWLNLKSGPSLRIDWSDWHLFSKWRMDELEGRRLAVRGWVYHRNGQQRMQVQHPASVEWLDKET